MSETTKTQYGFKFVKPGSGEPERHSRWYGSERVRDGVAEGYVAIGNIVTLQEKTTVVAERTTGILKPTQPDPESEARERVLATPTRTLFIDNCGSAYERRYHILKDDAATLVKLRGGRYVENLNLPDDFWQGLRRLVPEGE